MYLSIQYLRALAAFMVLLTHTSFKLENNGSDLLSWFNIGGYGVDLFFIISGFIMCLTVQDKKINFTTFMKQRVIRIIPLYWLMTSVALIIFFINPSLVNSSGGVTSIISSYLLIPDGTKYLVNNGWTLSYEFFFYFIFSLFLFDKGKQKLFTSIVLMTLFIFGVILNFDLPILKFITSPLLLEFIMGILAFEFIKKYKFKASISLLLLLFGFALLIFMNESGYYNAIFGKALTSGVPMFFVFLGFVSLESRVRKKKFYLELGMSSYSLYLVHPFTLAAITFIFKYLGIINLSVLYFFSMIGASLLSGWLCYFFIEKKLDTLIRSKKKLNIKTEKVLTH